MTYFRSLYNTFYYHNFNCGEGVENMAIRPSVLKRGDTIGLVTLGTPLDADTH